MSTVFSVCGLYRYRLDREIGWPGIGTVAFLLHNPSVAGDQNDDPTSTRGVNYAKAWGASNLIYINPWAGIATKKVDLWKMPDPVGPLNDWHIDNVCREVANSGGFMVCAWGVVNPPRHLAGKVSDRLTAVERLIRKSGCDVRALGFTKHGAPRHPLYMKSDALPISFAASHGSGKP